MKSKMFLSLLIASIVVAVQSLAKESSVTEDKLLRRQEAQQKVMEKHGGVLTHKGNGKMAIVNCQKRIDGKIFDAKIGELRHMTRMEVELMPGVFNLENVNIPTSSQIALFIIEKSGYPASMVAAESRWAVLNVAPLLEDGPSEAVIKSRMNKEFVRVAVMLFGGSVSQYRGSPLQPVFNVKMLDEVKGESFTVDAMGTLVRNLTALGFTQTKRATYRRACEEGWAPAPTNEFQRVVFDQVKREKERGPSNPIQIKP